LPSKAIFRQQSCQDTTTDAELNIICYWWTLRPYVVSLTEKIVVVSPAIPKVFIVLSLDNLKNLQATVVAPNVYPTLWPSFDFS